MAERVVYADGLFGSWNIASAMTGNPELEHAALNLFLANGYQLRRNQSLDYHNPAALGFGQGMQEPLPRFVSKQQGIMLPKNIPVDEIRSEKSVVIKHPHKDHGRGKFLLETDEQKVKYLTFAMLGNNAAEVLRLPNKEQVVDQLLDEVRSGNIRSRYLNDPYLLDYFERQEFIETPGQYYSSFRIVADAWGNIQYGQVCKSKEPKSKKMPPELVDFNPNESLDEACRGGWELYLLLQHPESPFFLDSRRFVSNISSKGERILLDGNPVRKRVNRQLLENLGIDPDHPTVPSVLQESASELGRFCRPLWPFAGLDYMKRQENEAYYFLEANIAPQLAAEPLNMDGRSSQKARQLEMMQRVIRSAPSLE